VLELRCPFPELGKEEANGIGRVVRRVKPPNARPFKLVQSDSCETKPAQRNIDAFQLNRIAVKVEDVPYQLLVFLVIDRARAVRQDPARLEELDRHRHQFSLVRRERLESAVREFHRELGPQAKGAAGRIQNDPIKRFGRKLTNC
jgi:hypothetical protein